MLLYRVITAAIGLPLLILFLVYAPPYALLGLFSLLVGISVFEVASMLFPKIEMCFVSHGSGLEQKTGKLFHEEAKMPFYLGFFNACIFFCLLIVPWNFYLYLFLAVILIFMADSLIVAIRRNSVETAFAYLATSVISTCYGALPWLFIFLLCEPDYFSFELGDIGHTFDKRLIFILLAIIWGGDTGAYFGGRFLGRHKLAPLISPKKTCEGSVVGLITSIVAGFAVSYFYDYYFNDQIFTISQFALFLACFFGGVLGQVGDLVESLFKRFAGVKDSGRLFPGHGGLLDRVDALLFAAPLVWLLFRLTIPELQ